ncbi:MAG: hypothetical protein HFJ35_01690 [Clostridia bacterium]|nr:hypothetical protein [Clostridia bacterium]
MKNLINRSKYDKIAYNIEKLNYGMITERNGKRMDKTQDTIELLRIYKQEHIIKLLNQLEGKEKEELIEQINKIDFHQIMELYDNTKREIEIKENKIENIAYLDKAKLSKDQKEEFDSLGEIAIRNKEYAVVTMAGGQGSRLRT